MIQNIRLIFIALTLSASTAGAVEGLYQQIPEACTPKLQNVDLFRREIFKKSATLCVLKNLDGAAYLGQFKDLLNVLEHNSNTSILRQERAFKIANCERPQPADRDDCKGRTIEIERTKILELAVHDLAEKSQGLDENKKVSEVLGKLTDLAIRQAPAVTPQTAKVAVPDECDDIEDFGTKEEIEACNKAAAK